MKIPEPKKTKLPLVVTLKVYSHIHYTYTPFIRVNLLLIMWAFFSIYNVRTPNLPSAHLSQQTLLPSNNPHTYMTLLSIYPRLPLLRRVYSPRRSVVVEIFRPNKPTSV